MNQSICVAASVVHLRRSIVRAVLAAGVALAASSGARAAVFTVTNINDAGAGSLRAAIDQANLAAGPDQVVFQAGLNGVIILGTELPTITGEITITGPGPRSLSISGSNLRRIFSASAGPVTISGLRTANGFTDRGGGMLFDSPALLSFADCHFDQHLATLDGGAICMLQGSLSVQRCTFTTDQAAGNGGCIWFGQGGGTPTFTLVNSTFVNNFASISGGAIRQGPATAYTSSVTNCTFVVNNSGTAGGAIAVGNGTMTILNSLFTANGAGGNPGGHVIANGGAITSLGHNIFGHLDGSNFAPDPTDVFGTAAAQANSGILIAFPFNNGGLTDTLPFSNSSSIAIDKGTATGAPVADQRGFIRVGCAPDVGAFEVQTVSDSDGDGVINCLDLCPNTPACASVNQTGCPSDGDADGVFDGCDACPGTLAGDPVNALGCSTADEDGDGIPNDTDTCHGTPPCALAAIDANGCPVDADGDGVFDGCDQCPGANDLTDTDADGIPDCLDPCPNDIDGDGDGVQDCQDGCPADPLKVNPGACGCGAADSDIDADGIFDCQDACPNVGDTDGDGVQDCQDGCPADPLKINPGACGCGAVDADIDGDGIFDCQDACPTVGDTDGDGVQDCQDGCPADPLKLNPGACGCGNVDADSDGDGIPDCLDGCAATPACAVVNAQGCTVDSDGDGVPDGCDQCPGTLAGDPVNADGCSTADEDGDGVTNDADHCRGTPPCAIASVTADGCPVDADGDGLLDGCDVCPGADSLADSDDDGIPDCLDACPNIGDSDGDGVQDCQDGCPNDPLKRDPGVCGCGAPDSDTDANGIPDCIVIDPPAVQPVPESPHLQPFVTVLPILPGLYCGVGLFAPMLMLVPGLMLIGVSMRAARRRR